MHILFANRVQVPIELTNSVVEQDLLGIYKNLQHVDIPFKQWDNPAYLKSIPYDQLVKRLVELADQISVKVDQDRCFNRDQEYFNYLHRLYEQRYDGNPKWLDFHEHIHLCESYHQGPRLVIHYREKAGLLQKKFNIDWLAGSTTKLKAGDVFLEWAELGKTPYSYWADQEPDDIDRICQLAKPWVNLIPKLQVALADSDTVADKNCDGFDRWWSAYQKDWCQHWQIPKWTVADQYSVITIGKIESIDLVADLLNSQIHPIRVQL